MQRTYLEKVLDNAPPARRPLRLRRRPRSATRRHAQLPPRTPRRPDAEHHVDLALPHRPHRRQPGDLGVLPPVRRVARRVGVDDARVRAQLPRHGPRGPRATVHRSALGEEPRARNAVLPGTDAPVRRRRTSAHRLSGQPVRSVEGPGRRDRRVPHRARTRARRSARSRRLDGDRRPRGLPGVGRDRGRARGRPRHLPALEPAPGRFGADQRVSAGRQRGRAEITARRLRPHRERRPLEGTTGHRGTGRRHQAADPRRVRRVSRRLDRGVRASAPSICSPIRSAPMHSVPRAANTYGRTSSRRASSKTG